MLPGGYRFRGRKYTEEVTEGYILPVKKKEFNIMQELSEPRDQERTGCRGDRNKVMTELAALVGNYNTITSALCATGGAAADASS